MQILICCGYRLHLDDAGVMSSLDGIIEASAPPSCIPDVIFQLFDYWSQRSIEGHIHGTYP